EGIRNKYPLEPPMEMDMYGMSEEERRKHEIRELPGNLIEAIEEVEKSALVKQALGEHVFSKFVENKKIEWDNYRIQVTSYELDKYLPIL
ncbi:MAG TPA: glutamine synthetase, partial [bacterium]|nr:glutamine synthetase [bacterium]